MHRHDGYEPTRGDDPSRRTSLANERTWLGWLRTGLTALGLALAVGKLLPDLAHHPTRWPYTSLGIGYAVVGLGFVAYGLVRRQRVETAARHRQPVPSNDDALSSFTGLVVLLGVGTIALLVAV